MVLGQRFDAALALAHRVHRQQTRKGTSIPYIAHVLGATSLVLEYGGNEDEAIAAVLHDVLEDVAESSAGLTVETLSREIEERFGTKVLSLVEYLTDTVSYPKPPWPERKASHLAALGRAPQPALLIAAADKLHNVRSLIRDYRSAGETLWERFNPEAGRDRTLAYYRATLELFKARLPGGLTDELERELIALEGLVSPRRHNVQRT
jgi:(p)ppGpp synthase/HD superfamily hydrolase